MYVHLTKKMISKIIPRRGHSQKQKYSARLRGSHPHYVYCVHVRRDLYALVVLCEMRLVVLEHDIICLSE